MPPFYRDRRARGGCWWRPLTIPLPCSSPLDRQLSFLRSGLLGNLYLHVPTCPVPLLQWLFQVRASSQPPGDESVPALQPSSAAGGRGMPFSSSGLGCFWIKSSSLSKRRVVQGLACGLTALHPTPECVLVPPEVLFVVWSLLLHRCFRVSKLISIPGHRAWLRACSPAMPWRPSCIFKLAVLRHWSICLPPWSCGSAGKA